MDRPILTSSPHVLGGTPVFVGTRVPIQTLIECLEGGESIDEFLDGFPTVTREQVIAFLEECEGAGRRGVCVKVLLDECVNRHLARDIVGHEVTTVPAAGWAAVKNGDLLALAEKNFDVLVTVDRNLSFQQSLPRFGIAVVVLRARSNRLVDLRRLVPKLLEVLPVAVRGQATWIDA